MLPSPRYSLQRLVESRNSMILSPTNTFTAYATSAKAAAASIKTSMISMRKDEEIEEDGKDLPL